MTVCEPVQRLTFEVAILYTQLKYFAAELNLFELHMIASLQFKINFHSKSHELHYQIWNLSV